MNQEIKQLLEQEAANFGKLCDPNNETLEKQADLRFGFVRGAQTILENPGEWGLFTPDQMKGQRNLYRGQLDKILTEYEAMKSKHNHVETWYESHIQKEKYREVLERLLEENMCSHAGDELIEEALKTGGKQ